MEKQIRGVSNRFLDINLDEATWKEFSLEDRIWREYLGGKGLGLKLFYDRLGDRLSGIDPLAGDNLLIFVTGGFVGSKGPCSARFSCVTKSPLTGIMASSSCGGPFGIALRTAGYDGVVVSGASAKPVSVEITDGGVDFRPAHDLWGSTTSRTQEALDLKSKDGACVIGPAGENGVLYANIASGHRFLGRGGFGAVMGAKNLKSLTARGGVYALEPARPEMWQTLIKKANRQIRRNPFIERFSKYGTAGNVNPCVDGGLMPVYNFRDRTDERARNISGEAMAEKYQTKPSTCKPCSVLCGHKGTYPDGYMNQIPEYETAGLFGPNIGNFDPDLIAPWNNLMNDLGMDTISAGATLSYAMEAGDRGLREPSLAFDRFDNIAAVLEDIACLRGEGKELSRGTRRLAAEYGGEDFAMHVKGLELSAYDPRGAVGQGLNYAVCNRGGCHLGAYPVSLEVLIGFLDPYTPRSKPFWVKYFENFFNALNSLPTCLFTAFGYVLETPVVKYTPRVLLSFFMTHTPAVAALLLDVRMISRFFSSFTGYDLSQSEMLKAGERIQVLERYMNTRMGITRKDDTLPGRFLKEGETRHAVKSTVPLEPMLDRFYKLRGYDENGIPKPALLRSLGIEGH